MDHRPAAAVYERRAMADTNRCNLKVVAFVKVKHGKSQRGSVVGDKEDVLFDPEAASVVPADLKKDMAAQKMSDSTRLGSQPLDLSCGTPLAAPPLCAVHHYCSSASGIYGGSSTVPCFPPTSPVPFGETRQARAPNPSPEQASRRHLPDRRPPSPRYGSGRSKRHLSHRIDGDGDGRRSPAGAAAGGGAPVLRALRGAADGDQEGAQPLRRRLRHHGRQRRRRAQGQGRHLQHPEPPHHPRRRRDAPPHHARKGVQHAPQMGGVQRGQHERTRPALQREDDFADPTQDGDGRLLGREHRAAGLRLQDQGQLLRQVLRLLPRRLQHHGCSNEP